MTLVFLADSDVKFQIVISNIENNLLLIEMKFLAEVLSSVEEVELTEVNKKVPELAVQIEDVKNQVLMYRENVYLNFSERPKQNAIFFQKVKTIETDVVLLIKNMEIIRKKQMSDKSQIEKHLATLNTINITLGVVSKLCEINEELKIFDEMLKSKEYLSCMKKIHDLELFTNQVTEFLEISQELQLMILKKKGIIFNELSNVFSENVKIEQLDDHLTILKINKEKNELQEVLKALYYDCSFINHLSSFVDLLWEYFISQTIDNVHLDKNENEYFNILEIKINVPRKKSDYHTVFNNLNTVFEFLKIYFDLELTENVHTMKLIGQNIRDNLSQLIITQCLEYTVPSTTEDLENYNVVIQNTKKFEKSLRSFGIFVEDYTPLIEFTKNIDVHFINKKCKEYLLASEAIMKKDLHDMKDVGVPYNPEKALEFSENELISCCVSKSAIELMDFLEKIILQAISASGKFAKQLLYTVKNIIIKYSLFVPQHHSTLLQTIPQQAALFQNNCFYISVEIKKWIEVYSQKFSPKLDTG